jgi:release factor glutamine methyltransferase
VAAAGSIQRVERTWTVLEALDWTRAYLAEKNDEHPRLSAEWLLSAATGLSRIEQYAYHDRPLTLEERAALREGVARRAKGEPLQYVTGEVPFRHLVLRIVPGVFIPRPETEVLVEAVLRHLDDSTVAEPVVVDLCTGSGAVALAIAQERPSVSVWATEITPQGAALAHDNAERAGVADRVTVLEGDLFAPVPAELRGRIDVVAANPPYIPTADLAALPMEVVAFEPMGALDGGPCGMDVIERIMSEAREWLAPHGALAIETDTARVRDAASAMSAWYECVSVGQDLTGRDRIAIGTRREA